jgi:hypothetical protein
VLLLCKIEAENESEQALGKGAGLQEIEIAFSLFLLIAVKGTDSSSLILFCAIFNSFYSFSFMATISVM